MKLTNKTILIISPNEWGIMHISKHHYAISLSKKNNSVYFLNPPNKSLDVKLKIEIHQEYPNLTIVTYKSFFPTSLRFHLPLLYKWLMFFQISLLQKSLNNHFDIIWSFETNLYWSLKWFKGDIRIYHPVDQVTGKYQKQIEDSSDFIFSVSRNILDKFKFQKNQLLINHGLSEHFERIAIKKLNQVAPYNIIQPFKIGYVGNLFIYALDRKTFKSVINHNSDIQFHIWSPITINESNVSGDASFESIEFIEFLKKTPNVFLKGSAKPEKLSEDIQEMDAFLICYDTTKDHNQGSNTHKILEYLSTGKVVISSNIVAYSDKSELIQMVKDNLLLPEKVKESFSKINHLNSYSLQQKRIQFSLENTYNKHISKIEEFIGLKMNKDAIN